MEGFAQRRPAGAQLDGGGVDAAEPLSEGEGAVGFGAVDKEPAGLPPHPLPGQLLASRMGRSWPTSPVERSGGVREPADLGRSTSNARP
jgi:hypothetical protein